MATGDEDVRIREARVGLDDSTVAALFDEYLDWASNRLAEEYGIDLRISPAQTREGLHEFVGNSGKLILAEQNGAVVGVGALRRVAAGVGEIKRMYVRPGARRLGVDGSLLGAIIQAAATMGLVTVRLDTARFMTEAHSLYRSSGFIERAAYAESEIPNHLHQYWMFFERHL